MSLNNMTLTELRDLASALTTLDDIGAQLAKAGLEPVFDLTPGAPVIVQVSFVMPDFVSLDAHLNAIFSGANSDDIPSFLKPRSTEAASGPDDAEAAPTQPAPVESPAVDQLGPQAGDPISSVEQNAEDVSSGPVPQVADASESVAEDSSGGQGLAAPTPPAAADSSEGIVASVSFGSDPVTPVPGSATAMASSAGQWAGEWTDEQDARLIGDLVAARLADKPKAAVFTALAHEFGRTAKPVELRSYKLKNLVAAATADAESALLDKEDSELSTPTPVSPALAAATDGSTASDGAAVAVENIPAAVQSEDALTAHLRCMTDKGGWSLARDLELMELSCEGWQPNEIALQLTMQANAIKPRFDALTGLHEDDATGKKVRRWTREEVLGALLVMAGKAAA